MVKIVTKWLCVIIRMVPPAVLTRVFDHQAMLSHGQTWECYKGSQHGNNVIALGINKVSAIIMFSNIEELINPRLTKGSPP